MIEEELLIKNTAGLHCRPCSFIVNEARKFKSDITLIKEEEYANAKNMMDLVILALKQGDKVTLNVKGDDEEKAFAVVKDLVIKEYEFSKS